jgi:LuxR family transcriptional regulator
MRRLSRVQTGILDWIAEGKSNVDIGAIMGMNKPTVLHHVSEILRKLGVAPRIQVAAMRRSASEGRR